MVSSAIWWVVGATFSAGSALSTSLPLSGLTLARWISQDFLEKRSKYVCKIQNYYPALHAFPKTHIKWPLICGCCVKLKNQYLVFRMGAQLRMARVLTVIVSDLKKTTGSLLLVELSRIVIWGGAHGAEVMMTLAEASRASGVTSFLAKTLTRYTPKELKCKTCMPKIW